MSGASERQRASRANHLPVSGRANRLPVSALQQASPPRILVSNDDGINALGIKTLERIARTLSDDVWVVAPETNQSGAAHSLTLTRPLRVRRHGERHFSVDGTPTGDGVAVSDPGDRFEREAEATATSMMSGGEVRGATESAGPQVQRQGEDEMEDESVQEIPLQREGEDLEEEEMSGG